MKYLEIREISQFSTALSLLESKENSLEFKLEAYSMKETRRQRKENKGKAHTPASLVAEVLNLSFPDYDFR